jgi:hypothetical protein
MVRSRFLKFYQRGFPFLFVLEGGGEGVLIFPHGARDMGGSYFMLSGPRQVRMGPQGPSRTLVLFLILINRWQ